MFENQASLFIATRDWLEARHFAILYSLTIVSVTASGCAQIREPGNKPDRTPPTVSIQAPASDATVSGSVIVVASASDDVRLASLQFQVNNQGAGPVLTGAPYGYVWDTTSVPDGPNTIAAIAKDAAGNTAKTTRNVTVKNKRPDTTPPNVSIISPSMGATLSGMVIISADASDDVGVASVQFQVDGANSGAPFAVSPYSYSWNSTSASNGSHILGAIAKDKAGNQGSATVAVTVTNPGPSTRSCPPPPSYPTAACTGVPPGTIFTTTIDGDYFAVTPNQVIDKWHVTGSLLILANNVSITSSQIDNTVNNENAGEFAPYTITDTTVGPATGCITSPGVNDQNYVALRVHIRGHDDGFRAGGPNITVRDSYVQNCVDNPQSHADGIQDYPSSKNLVFDHNTIDMCEAWTTDRSQPACNVDANYPGINGGVFIASNPSIGGGSSDVTITNNLIVGGIISVWLWPARGTWTVTGNRVVDQTWKSVPYETNGLCANIKTWSDNTIVTMDTSYNITSIVETVACPK